MECVSQATRLGSLRSPPRPRYGERWQTGVVSNHMKFCGQCGTQAPADGRFCGSCGHELGRQTASSPPEPARTEEPLVLSPGDALARLQKARSRLEHRYGRPATLSELAAEVEMPEEKFTSAPEHESTGIAEPIDPKALLIARWGSRKAVAVIIGLLTAILYWVFADTPAQCVGKVVCQQDDRLMVGTIFGVLATGIAWFVVNRIYSKVVLFTGVVSLTFCLVGGQLDSVEGINGVGGGIVTGLILWPFVHWLVRSMMPSSKKARADEADRLHAQEKAKEAASGWQSVTRVVCPHCQEAGGVQRFIPYEPPRDLLKEGLKWHLVDKTVGHVDVDPAEKIGRDIREASQKAQTPNMRCSNCTVEWRV